MMDFLRSCFRVFWTRIIPVLVLVIAVFLGYLQTDSRHPEGRLFAVLIPLWKGYCPSSICGTGSITGTPGVPAAMKPQPRPKGEKFLDLPGGYKMPMNGIGMCCRPTAYDDECVRRTVLWYLLMGGRHIDTASIYYNHKAVGEGVPRKEIFLTTKIFPSNFGYNSTKELIPKFNEELGVDYIDLVLMHFPSDPFRALRTTECSRRRLNASECRKDTWKAFADLRKQGLVRSFGVSNFNIDQIKELQSLNILPVANNQIQYNPWAPRETHEVVEYCKENRITITAYSPVGGLMLHGTSKETQTLKYIAKKHGKSVSQIMLRWALQKNTVVIPGTGNPNHMQENLDIFSMQLSKEDMDEIDQLAKKNPSNSIYHLKLS